MKSFADIVHTLLKRIRMLQAAYTADPRPPAASLTHYGHCYRVPSTTWGVDDGEVLPPYLPVASPVEGHRRPLVMTNYASPFQSKMPSVRPIVESVR